MYDGFIARAVEYVGGTVEIARAGQASGNVWGWGFIPSTSVGGSATSHAGVYLLDTRCYDAYLIAKRAGRTVSSPAWPCFLFPFASASASLVIELTRFSRS